MKKTVREKISSYREEIVRFTRELVALPTENPPGNRYRECVGAIRAKLEEIGLDCREAESHGREDLPAAASLLAFHGEGKKTLYFHGHYDVVPAQDGRQFAPAVKGANLFGRGSSDMKGGLAAMIFAVRALRECRIDLGGRIGLVFVPDEETGGARGSAFLAKEGILGRDGIGMLTPEPTSGVVWNGSRGAFSLRITAKGKHAHVGLQFQGINAFDRMLEVAAALRTLKETVEKRKTAYRIRPEVARKSILLLGGLCEGGTSFNAVPDRCSFTVDRRINPEEDLEEEKQAIFRVLDRFGERGMDLEVEVLQEGEPSGTPADHPLAGTLAARIREVTGRLARFSLCPGLLETRYYARRGIPAFAFGPGLLAASHGPKEFVQVEKILECAAVYALTAARFLGTGNPSGRY